jgi:MFS transporter, CP family, cyanate transporter
VWTATMAWVFARGVARPLSTDTASHELADPAQGAWPSAPLGPLAPIPPITPSVPSPPGAPTATTLAALRNGATRLRQTLASPGAWCVALAFACYSAQWLAVIGFLPTIYLQAGWGAAQTAFATAAVAAVNIIGNVSAGRWLQRGVPPMRLLRWGYSAMALAAVIAFSSGSAWPLPLPLRLLAIALFSMCGGLIPATLFTQAVRHAPTPQAVGTTVGWVQQGSASGQFFGPPLVAWVATANGGWQFTGLAVAVMGLLGLALTVWLARLNAALDTRLQP